jgi:hypothetical protein
MDATHSEGDLRSHHSKDGQVPQAQSTDTPHTAASPYFWSLSHPGRHHASILSQLTVLSEEKGRRTVLTHVVLVP